MLLTKDTYTELAASYRGSDITSGIQRKLVPLWCDDYSSNHKNAELVLVDIADSTTSFKYLFDITLGRNIAAFGVPAFAQHKRDASRMAGHPLSDGADFHRGHLMAHSIGKAESALFLFCEDALQREFADAAVVRAVRYFSR